MHKSKIKFCGIRSKENALAALEVQADFVGFNFIHSSSRFINEKTAQSIIPLVKGKIPVVGVFMNQDSVYINHLIHSLSLDFVQLHGDEGMEFIRLLHAPVIKTFLLNKQVKFESIMRKIALYQVAYYLLDITKGEDDTILSYINEIKKFLYQDKLFLSGGLTVKNIAPLLSEYQPFAFDIARGIESNGKIDILKMKEFIKIVRGQ